MSPIEQVYEEIAKKVEEKKITGIDTPVSEDPVYEALRKNNLPPSYIWDVILYLYATYNIKATTNKKTGNVRYSIGKKHKTPYKHECLKVIRNTDNWRVFASGVNKYIDVVYEEEPPKYCPECHWHLMWSDTRIGVRCLGEDEAIKVAKELLVNEYWLSVRKRKAED